MGFTAIGPSVYDGTMQELRDDVAPYLLMLARDYEAETGEKVLWGDALRSDVEQAVEFRRNYTSGWPAKGSIAWAGQYWRKIPGRPTTAVPGRSNHRLGTTIDFYITARFLAWLKRNAARYGFTNTEGASVGENWHWGWVVRPSVTLPAGGTGTPIEVDDEEDDMGRRVRVRSANGTIALSDGGSLFYELEGGPDQEKVIDGWKLWERGENNKYDVNLSDEVYQLYKAIAIQARGTGGATPKEVWDHVIANKSGEGTPGTARNWLTNMSDAVANILVLLGQDGVPAPGAPATGIPSISDADLVRIQSAVNDEYERRERARYAKSII